MEFFSTLDIPLRLYAPFILLFTAVSVTERGESVFNSLNTSMTTMATVCSRYCYTHPARLRQSAQDCTFPLLLLPDQLQVCSEPELVRRRTHIGIRGGTRKQKVIPLSASTERAVGFIKGNRTTGAGPRQITVSFENLIQIPLSTDHLELSNIIVCMFSGYQGKRKLLMTLFLSMMSTSA